MKELRLANDVLMPAIGFGTYLTPADETGYNAVSSAVAAGYRLIDCAAKYDNERLVGKALKESGISRRELFITSKVWNDARGYDATMRAFEKSITALGVDYLDLYLIHWPASPARYDNWRELNSSSWKALENLLDLKCVRAIGVSNFKQTHLEPLLAEADIAPMVNQIECNPGHRQEEIRSFCNANDIIVQAWSPLGRGRILENQILTDLAQRYGKTVAQISLRWAVQSGIVPIPKSDNPGRIKQNIDIFDFSLSEEDMKAIDSLPGFGYSGLDPDAIDF